MRTRIETYETVCEWDDSTGEQKRDLCVIYYTTEDYDDVDFNINIKSVLNPQNIDILSQLDEDTLEELLRKEIWNGIEGII